MKTDQSTKKKPITEARWCVELADSGFPLARGWCQTLADAQKEVMHYAMQYAQDDPVRWWVRQNRKTVVEGSLGKVTVTMTAKSKCDLRDMVQLLGSAQ